MAKDLSDWKPYPLPHYIVMNGRFCRLKPLDAAKHGDQLFAAATSPDADDRFRYLPEVSPESRDVFQGWLDVAQASEDPLYFAVIDKRTGTVEGRQTLKRIDAANGVIETGHIFWGRQISRAPVTTEAFFLFARHIFDDLGYRRFEWKCNNANEASKRAAERFGMSFEGVFRQHLIVKSENRDTAWYSILDHEWPTMQEAFERRLDPANFDGEGHQIKKLQELKDG